jgi:hypothetical protein
LTAKQLCSGFSASISVGGTLHLRAVSTPTVENTSMAFVYPIGLNTNELEVRHTFSFQKGKTSRAGADEQMDVVLHASARRLPDPDGLAAYPQCPKR